MRIVFRADQPAAVGTTTSNGMRNWSIRLAPAAPVSPAVAEADGAVPGSMKWIESTNSLAVAMKASRSSAVRAQIVTKTTFPSTLETISEEGSLAWK